MNIADNNFNIKNMNTTNITNNNINVGGKLQAVTQGNVPLSANAQITQMQIGQMFSGQITDITGNNVSILMNGQNTLMARMAESINLNIGDAITFTIKENDGNNVVIKPQVDNMFSAKDSTIFKILDQNNLSPTAKNYQIAESLMKNGMPVDKQGMQRIMQYAYKYPEASIDTLVNMSKLGLEINEANIKQYESFKDNNHQILNNINQMADDFVKLSGELTDNITMNIGANQGHPDSFFSGELIATNAKLLAQISDSPDFPSSELSGIKISQAQSQIDSTVLYDLDGISTELSDKLELPKTEIKDMLNKLHQMGVDKESINKLSEESKTPLQFLNNVNKLLEENKSQIDFAHIKELIKSDSYEELLATSFKKKFTLDGENMKNPTELDEHYESLYEKAGKLMESFSDSGSAGKNLSDNSKSFQERMDFIKNLNEMFTYAQIPVNISGDEMNSELFVYMNKKALKDNKEDVSALLHLDMEFLGPTDVHVSLHGSNVHTRFYVDDEISAKILDEHMTMLEKAVNEAGFNLTNEVVNREISLGTENMVVNQMFGDDLEQSVKRYSFDVRT